MSASAEPVPASQARWCFMATSVLTCPPSRRRLPPPRRRALRERNERLERSARTGSERAGGHSGPLGLLLKFVQAAEGASGLDPDPYRRRSEVRQRYFLELDDLDGGRVRPGRDRVL